MVFKVTLTSKADVDDSRSPIYKRSVRALDITVDVNIPNITEAHARPIAMTRALGAVKNHSLYDLCECERVA